MIRQIKTYPSLYIATIICFPLILLLINDSWAFFSTAGWVDYCLYQGYFLNLKQLLTNFPSAYYGTRLPWLLLGYSAHAIAPPEIASYIVRLVLFYAAAFSLFAIVRMLWRNDLAATMAALLMGSNTYFLWAIGWDYLNGMGLVLILVTTACLTAAATAPSRKLWLAAGGVAFVCMVSTYLPLICFVPVQIAGYLLLNRWRSRDPLAISAAWFAAGAAAAVAFFGAVNWWLAGRFLYFMPQIAMAQTVGAAPGRWKAPDYSWIANATWLIVPAIALVIGLVLLAVVIYWRLTGATPTELHRNVATAALLLIGIELVFVITEMKGFWFLQASYFASFLIPYAYICIGAALVLATARIGEKWRPALLIVTAAILLVPFFHLPFESLRPCAPSCQVEGHVGWLALAGCLILAASALTRTAWLTVPALLALSLSNISAADVSVFSFPPSTTARSHYSLLFDAVRAIKPYNPDGDIRFWYNRQEPLGGLFQSIGWAFLWGRGRVVSEDFPNRNDNRYTGTLGQVNTGDTVAILSSSADSPAAAAGTLAKIGLKSETLGHAYVRRGAEGLHLNFIRVSRTDMGIDSPIPITGIEGFSPTSVVKEPDGSIGIWTEASLWTYAAFLKIPPAVHQASDTCGGIVKLRVHVEHGIVGIGILSATQKDFVARRYVPTTPVPVDVTLEIPKLADSSGVLVQAWDAGVKSFVDVRSASIAPYACPAGTAAAGASQPGGQPARR